MDQLLTALKAAGEMTRLRLLAVLARGELTVSELTRVVGQSQPRVSRHLRLLCEAGLLDRYQEGTWAFYRLAENGLGARVARDLLDLVPEGDPLLARDRERLEAVKVEHGAAATAYFRKVAARWDRIRSLYVDDSEVEAAMLAATAGHETDSLVDLGTGTGRILQLFGPRVRRGVGIDRSHEMLSVARANLEESDLRHCRVRKGDLFNLSMPGLEADLVTIHLVLHFLDDPGAAVREAARILRPGGQLLIVDFAPHALEVLRREYAHRRLGFADAEVAAWCTGAGLGDMRVRHLPPRDDDRDGRLTVSLWTCRQGADSGRRRTQLEVA